MSFIVSTQAELLKTKRTASFWLSVIGASLIPTLFFISYFTSPDEIIQDWSTGPWEKLFMQGWQFLNIFLLPMYIILVSTLITQIEFRNNTWKQVFASPQSLGNIFFSKFATVQLMIIFCFLLFNTLMILGAVIATLFNPKLPFLNHGIDWEVMLKLNLKTYISTLGISAIQYCLAMRFRNFIAPVGVGLALVIGSVVATNMNWQHIHKYPYAAPFQSLVFITQPGRPFLENHEWNSLGYFVFFMLVGFFDMKLKKERG